MSDETHILSESDYAALIDYAEGELFGEERERMDHLVRSDAAYRSAYREILSLTAKVKNADAPADPGEAYFESLSRRVLTQIDEAPDASWTRRAIAWLGGPIWRPLLAAAPALAVVIAVGLSYFTPTTDDTASPVDTAAIVAAVQRQSVEQQLLLAGPEGVADQTDTDTEVSDEDLAVALLDNDENLAALAEDEPETPDLVARVQTSYSDLDDEDLQALAEYLESVGSWEI